MGLLVSQAKFRFPVPQPSIIAKAMTEIGGLPVEYLDGEGKLELHEFCGSLSFKGFPEIKIEILAYKPRAVRKFHDDLGLPEPAALLKPQGYYDTEEVQRVYIEGQGGDEPTLFLLTLAALQRLGGDFEDVFRPDAAFDRPLTEAELRARIQANRSTHRRRAPLCVLAGLFMVATLPFHLAWTLVSMPIKLRRIYKKYPGLRR